MAKPAGKCAVCGADLMFKYKPMPEWNLSGFICGQCYGQRLTEHYIAPERRNITKR